MEKIDCSEKQYCYIKVKGGVGGEEKQGAHATKQEFEGGCALPSDPVVQTSGINKNNLPSCVANKNEGKIICVCNSDECNKMETIGPKIEDLLKKTKEGEGLLGGTAKQGNGSPNLTQSFVLLMSTLMFTYFIRV